jgi:hypothetical protein
MEGPPVIPSKRREKPQVPWFLGHFEGGQRHDAVEAAARYNAIISVRDADGAIGVPLVDPWSDGVKRS